jgi:hypothetical protein
LWQYILQQEMRNDDIPKNATEIPTYYTEWEEDIELSSALENLEAFLSVQTQYRELMAEYVALKSSVGNGSKSNDSDDDKYDQATMDKINILYHQAHQLQENLEWPTRWKRMAGMIHAFDLCASIVLVGLDQLIAPNEITAISTVGHKLRNKRINLATAIAISRNFFTDELPTAFNKHCPGEMSELFKLLDPVSAIPAWKGVPNQFRSKTVVSVSRELQTLRVVPIPWNNARIESFRSLNQGTKRHMIRSPHARARKLRRKGGAAGHNKSARRVERENNLVARFMARRRTRRRSSLPSCDEDVRQDAISCYSSVNRGLRTSDVARNEADRTAMDEEEDEEEEVKEE